MTKIPQHEMCCLATSKLKVRLKNCFALGCSCLPSGFCARTSLGQLFGRRSWKLSRGCADIAQAKGRSLVDLLGCRELCAVCLVARQQSSPLKSAQHPTAACTFPRTPNELWMSQPGYFHEPPLLHCFPRQLSCGCKPPPGPNTSDI